MEQILEDYYNGLISIEEIIFWTNAYSSNPHLTDQGLKDAQKFKNRYKQALIKIRKNKWEKQVNSTIKK